MSNTINVQINNVSTNNGSAAGGDQIAELRKKLATLQKKLQEVEKSPDKNAVKQAELLQQQIMTIQAQIAELEARKNQQSQNAASSKVDAAAQNKQAKTTVKAQAASPSAIGSHVDEYI